LIWWAFIVDSPHFAVWWLPRGKRHVSYARHLATTPEGEVWLVLDPTNHQLLTPLLLQDSDLVGDMVASGAIAVALPDRGDGKHYWRGLMTCVAMGKFLAGLRWPLVLTPSGLIRRAIREGFEVRYPC
jgi:hypothetical protein